jgi:hypothetical protein
MENLELFLETLQSTPTQRPYSQVERGFIETGLILPLSHNSVLGSLAAQ